MRLLRLRGLFLVLRRALGMQMGLECMVFRGPGLRAGGCIFSGILRRLRACRGLLLRG